MFFQGVKWTPSKMIQRLGKEINNTNSVCYWAYKVGPAHICDWATQEMIQWWEMLCVAEWHPHLQSCPDRRGYRRHAVSLLHWQPWFDPGHHWRYIMFVCLFLVLVLKFVNAPSTGLMGCVWSDIARINSLAVACNSSGMIILGGGIAKHHICNANIWVSIQEWFWSLWSLTHDVKCVHIQWLF